ncbi:galactose oxidase [Polychaeton citri CBS 116435]|uniref:Galactose oxidase n=1 Tax=Polychaeton citri CBS 116435 TaxID=1314669 RepID=A0A9P4Q0S4_9PEZI|nr:galactose oxidase [Polychaeton citri CBS 116435]
MAKDKKKKTADKKARVEAKQAKKAGQKEKKQSKRPKDEADSDAEDADLDAILAEYQKKQEQFLKVTEEPSEPPSPRSSSTMCASPNSNSNELLLFGGEYWNGALAYFYNDLFVYKTNSDSWRKVTSPNSPLPRSGHAMCQGGNAGGIYLFGGEFSSPKQGTFYHYNDFWRLEPNSREWTKLEGKGGPPARSGHRMTYFKNYIVLFGGFQDTSQQTKYLQDVWLYDTQRFQWHQPALSQASGKPDSRSSFTFLPHESGCVLFGGYSRVKASATTSKATKGGKPGSSRVIMKPIVHQDTWFLRITPPASDAPANAAPTVRWERRKRPANTPNPLRAGATMAYHKGRGILFGGVHDVELSEEGIDSEFFNQLFAYNIDRNRFFPLGLRRPRISAKKTATNADRAKKGGRGKADEEELLRNLALIENKIAPGDVAAKDNEDNALLGPPHSDDEDPEGQKVEKPTLWDMPHPRFNAQLAVQDDTLFIYGGTFEKGDREYTFDELWAIDLGKMDGVKQVFKREIEDWQGSDDEDDDEDEDYSDDEGGSSDSEAEAGAEVVSTAAVSATPAQEEEERIKATQKEEEEDETEPTQPAAALLDDKLPQPRPFESLREFFSRTSNEWQNEVLVWLKFQRDIEDSSVKSIRKKAFERAEQRWWDCREVIQALEDEQEAAGIGEVVALDQRGGGEGPRRR